MKRLLAAIVLTVCSFSLMAEEAEVTISSSFPKTGTVRVPVLLGAFTDVAFSVENPREAFSALLNEDGYSANNATGSAHEYYYLSSDGQLNLIFDVYGPFTVSHNREYYGGNTSTSHYKNAQGFVTELINLAADAGVDFSLYDANNDGVVDNISIFFAGYSEAEGGPEECIWPHQSSVNVSPRHNGKTFGSYLVTSELRSNKGAYMAGIGTYCHEFGHVLGLPDFYNTANNTSDEKIYTLGSWDIMCSGSYNNLGRTPPLFSAFERFMMGWLEPVQISEKGMFLLKPLAQENMAFLLASTTHNLQSYTPSPSEYFLIENRQRIGWEGRHTDCLPGVGLLISHITFSSRNWDRNTFNNAEPLGVDFVEAYGNHDKEAPYDTYPGTMNVTTMTPVLNNGDSLTSLRLNNILQRNSGVVSFVLGPDAGSRFTFTPEVLDTFITTFDAQPVTYTPQTLTISGKGIQSPVVKLAFSNKFFSIKADSTWTGTGQVFTDSVNPDGTYSRTVEVRFNPLRQLCVPTTSILQVFSGDSAAFNQLSLQGLSPRPVYITKPDSLTASEVTTSTARIEWKEVDDAEIYTLRAYCHNRTTLAYEQAFEREIVAPNSHAYLSGLESNIEYKVVVTASENKGCEEHYAPSDTLTVQTLIDTDTKKGLPVVQQSDGTCQLLLPSPAEEGMTVYLYTTDGYLVASSPVPAGTLTVTLPTASLVPHTLYLLKYVPTASRLRRSDHWSKFIYNP